MNSLPFALEPLDSQSADVEESWSRRLIIGLAVGLVLIGGSCVGYGIAVLWKMKNQIIGPITCSDVESLSTLHVDVGGSVKNPGVYSVAYGGRVSDALAAAGGLSDHADERYVQQSINLAQAVIDGQKIYIPSRAEREMVDVVASTSPTTASSIASGGVSLNAASAAQLQSLPGIGEKRAADIIAARPFSSVGELLENKLVPSNVYKEIEPLISL